MDCPSCGAAVPEGGRFCVNCGAAIAPVCPACGFANPPGARFCAGCGARLAGGGSPEGGGEPPPARRAAHEAERRQLTVLFCDLVGSTELAARLDPEDMGAVIRAYQGRCADVVRRWDGHVAKYLGDGVLVYFGYPRAHEDDAERAVRAGLELTRAVGELDTPAGERLAARVGIATGLVMAGELVGEGAAREAAVVGETPNLAARLQTLAEPGTVVVAPATRRLLGAVFEVADLGPCTLKGFAEPVRAWCVVRESAAESRFEARQAGDGLTPLVGREEEAALLLRRWELAEDGEGQVVLLSGEPGIGKSRLVRALRERVAAEPHTPLRYQCSPYRASSALFPVIDQLERAAGFERDDGPGRKLAKLETLLTESTGDAGAAAPLLAALLSVPTGDRYPPLDLTPQQQKERTLAALVAQLEGLAAKRPVLMIFEDAHWIDPTSAELLGLVIERIRGLPVLLVITFRPEFRPPWAGHAHATTLTLNRLSRRQAAAMVERTAGGKALPREVLDEIVARTDGVPLFVEELTKTVLESGLLRDAGGRFELAGPLSRLAIPATLHDSLIARLDRLAPVKEVAQIAAVVGREFSHDLLAAVAPLPEAELSAALDRLVSSGLIFRRGTPPDSSYSFKHALVQDVARHSLLKAKRQQLDARVAQTLIERFPATVNTEPEVVAYHFSEAGMAEEAVEYWHRAGERAVQRSANSEAIRHLEAALELLALLPEGRARAECELRLLTLLSPAQMVTKSRAAPEVAATLERARAVAQELQSLNHLIPATLGLWYAHMNRGDFDKADGLTRELFDLARRGGDDGFLLQAHHAAWTTPMFTGNFERVRRHVERGLALYDRRRHGGHAFLYLGHDPLACAHALGAVALWMLGHTDQALRQSAAAITSAEEIGHAPTLVHVLMLAGALHVVRGDPGAVAAVARRLFAIASELNMAPGTAAADSFAGWALAQDGASEEGLARLERGIRAWRAAGARLHLPQRLSMLADGLSLAGRSSEALDANAEARRLAETTGERWYQAMILWQRGRLLGLADGGVKRSEAAFQESLALAREQKARSVELRAATSLARLWLDRGERREAYDLLAPIYGWFTEGFDTPDLKEARALLDGLS